jgi:hypothetical protein
MANERRQLACDTCDLAAQFISALPCGSRQNAGPCPKPRWRGSVVTKDVLANGTVAGNRDHFVPLGQQSIGRGARFDAAENRRARAN